MVSNYVKMNTMKEGSHKINVFDRTNKSVYIHTYIGQTLEGCVLENEECIYKDKDGF